MGSQKVDLTTPLLHAALIAGHVRVKRMAWLVAKEVGPLLRRLLKKWTRKSAC